MLEKEDISLGGEHKFQYRKMIHLQANLRQIHGPIASELCNDLNSFKKLTTR
jgi:hypothetical protein